MGAALMNRYTVITYKSAGGSIRFAADTDFWITGITGIQTDVSLTTSQSAGQQGATVSGQSVQPKKLTVSGAILGRQGRAQLEEERRLLLAAVRPLEHAVITFVLGDESWYLEGYPTRTPVLSDGLRPQEFQFQFYVPYPYFRSTEQKQYQIFGLRALWRTPFYTGGRFYISRHTEDAFVHVENSGDTPQSIILTLSAAAEVTDPVVWHVGSGRRIAICRTMAPGERLVISTHDSDRDAGKAVRLFMRGGAEQNGFRYLAPDSDLSMQAEPGDNIFMADAAGNKQNLRCTLTTSGGERHSI